MDLLKTASNWIKSASVICTGALLCLSASNVAASQEELKGVKSQISQQQQSLSAKQKELNSLQASLKKEELSISSLTSSIQATEKKLTQANNNLNEFEQQKATLEQTKQQQTDTLEKLLSTFYATQQHGKSATQMWNGDQSPEAQRLSYYYQHLAKARAKAISELEQTEASLEAKNKQLINEQQQIQTLLAKQTSERDKLRGSQQARKSTVSKISKTISGSKTQLAELQRNETRLKAEIAKAAKRNAVPMDGLARYKGKLPWPVKGNVLQRYGSNLEGQVNLKGIVIDGKYEQPVKAVYSGTVVFAEYLRGYGLVVLLDHGKGDMTLYGYNQVLTKKEGDKVTAGETIALVGDTGGQTRPSLYFEVRRNSKTQNPTQWLQ
ncbi:murein hydrolase activator EnvC family protein [Vibrio ulleungensis]|uniref:Peptidoglycan DD-metalloendopeptidase family protein n=1 Tax=Vibrio ulleungensis TaxID=2807619 RepID=A0ABS2HLB4_9VIBR|nr:peptidoglycan DD-metalloendopeptidase family protein [Vibrio ulleungensis]MBM7038280.1 peptidoglycan DD-metalloendopeptidase family protein [Vibrio ulleungensis]